MAAWTRGVSSALKVLAKMLPSTATPMVEPIERKNSAELLATPVICGGTAFCTASVYSGMAGPSPRPIRIILSVTSAWVDWGVRVKPMMMKAAARTTMPASISGL
ncbi:hypothetical protein Mterra_03304 [Calidithermus terrae]|uniref:Uncharacterized protein n=1 Tax=Calidithermus terrae TaxID=1408545 RepID=A0A399EE45_9DEIN|nr:hypothetical protein Mterra_03304 [Calidithermus terrae]